MGKEEEKDGNPLRREFLVENRKRETNTGETSARKKQQANIANNKQHKVVVIL